MPGQNNHTRPYEVRSKLPNPKTTAKNYFSITV